MLLLIILLAAATPMEKLPLPTDFALVRQFENPKGFPLALPGAVDFDSAGNMYLLDQVNGRVVVWDAKGLFLKSFGEKGLQPEEGQMRNPITLAVGEKEVYLWCRNGLMFIYSLEGQLLRNFQVPKLFPKALAVLGPDQILMGSGIFEAGKLGTMVMRSSGTRASEVIRFESDMMLGQNPHKQDQMMVKAFGPDIDFQKNEKGKWYIGYGGEPFLFPIDADGNILGQVAIELPLLMISDEEASQLKQMSFPVWSKQRVQLEDDQTQLSFRDPKAGFTQFTLKGGKGLFVVTATGGYPTDIYAPNSFGNYHILDLKTNTLLKSGNYSFPTDSKIFFKNGHIIAAITDPKGAFQVAELALAPF